MKRREYKLRIIDSNVKELTNRSQKNVFITGFQGFGGVGYLTTRYIVTKLNMRLIGCIEPLEIPDFTSVEDYGFSYPHEIFLTTLNNTNIFVLLNRVNPERKRLSNFVETVIEAIKELHINEVYLVGGLDARFREGNEEFRWLKTSSASVSIEAPYFIKGAYIVGPLAALLLSLERSGIPAVAVFPYTEPESIDPKAAAIAIKVLSSLLKIEIDVGELMNYAEKIEEIEKNIQEVLASTERKESIMHT